MGNPVYVSVLAPDPVLAAGATAALREGPGLALAPRDAPADVAVVLVDRVDPLALDAVRRVRDTGGRSEVVLVASDFTQAQALHAIAAGARGLVRRREAGSARLARTVLAVAEGDCSVPPDMLALLLEPDPGRPPAPAVDGSSDGVGLDERERAVLHLVAEGRETGEIARELSYSIRTVSGVVHDITRRFRLRNRAHAVAYALRAGLL
ncbi:response regulator transcription factor [Micromonospora sp. NPDC023956]|uniref:helix-turn-helix transcriptional regulator n=1 Tax=Micromonospora sp. NPDC023956 TaxID=3155722 RepID=UPI0033D365EA